ncbi:hypothetical protein N9C06_03830 [Salibacteraceae bacterium]|jgi:uncharacterized protein with von Willebrand factor type A (vWA) domain|nr:hypothetical protein [Salibacteraceae bacterium]
MLGHRFTEYFPEADQQTPYERLLDIFMELLTHTSGDVEEAMDWLRELDKEHNLTTEDYSLDDFVDDLIKNGIIEDPDSPGGKGKGGGRKMSAKAEQMIRKRAMDQIFGRLKKGGSGQHRTNELGKGEDNSSERREYEYGDPMEQIAMTDSIRNAQINNGLGDFKLTERDLEVEEYEYKSSTATVLMIDISHSMILYGEDRITPAKKVAMALAELIRIRYPKDSLDIVVFGNDAWPIKIKDLPYLQVGPYHTNTVAGLELAMDILRRKKKPNKQIFMITDGKPSCLKQGKDYYKNSVGLDPIIVSKTINLARQCRKVGIPITTFMIAQDPYLQRFIEDFTEANKGKAFYSGLQGLGSFVFSDFENNRKRRR